MDVQQGLQVILVVGQFGEVVFLEEQVGVVRNQFFRQFFEQLLVVGMDTTVLEPGDVLDEHGEQGQDEGDGACLGVAVVEVDTGDGEQQQTDVIKDYSLDGVAVGKDIHGKDGYKLQVIKE